MEAAGIKSWFRKDHPWEIDPHDRHFFEHVFAQPWAPKDGAAVELGCGTGPIARWLGGRGFKTTGLTLVPRLSACNVIYYPCQRGERYSDSRSIKGFEYFPGRFLGHWEKILSDLQRAGLRPSLVRFNRCLPQEPVSSLNVAAIKL